MESEVRDTYFNEWRHLNSKEPVMQGDILRRQTTDTDPWKEWLIVITADCDLAHSKHGGSLSCVSVLHHEDYLTLFRTEKMVEAVEESLIRGIVEAAASAPETSSRVRPQVSAERWKSWILDSRNEKINSSLNFDDGSWSTIEPKIDAFRNLQKTKSRKILPELISAIAQSKVAIGDIKTMVKAKNSVVKEMSATLKRLPGDAMFIGSLAEDAREGYVAYLRRIHEVADTEVVRSKTPSSISVPYIRVGRLATPYIYALTQQVGSVFGSIGLPVEYESNREQTADLFDLLQTE